MTHPIYRVGIYPRLHAEKTAGTIVFARRHHLATLYTLNDRRIAALRRVLGDREPTSATGAAIIYGEALDRLQEPA